MSNDKSALEIEMPVQVCTSNAAQAESGWPPLVFIHAAPRTSSTWFWSKFRENADALCYYEPFTSTLAWVTPDLANTLGGQVWDSRHSTTGPYYSEYIPLIASPKGVDGYDRSMNMEWFIPQGGLHGELRSREVSYLSRLIEHARTQKRIPVFGDCWSLGRMWAIKRSFPGVHIFQYRNLWQQWLSYLSYRRRGDGTFYVTVMDTIYRRDDPFLSHLFDCGLRLAAQPAADSGRSRLRWKRPYVLAPRDRSLADRLEFMPEQHTFSLFMGLHVYLYLHAQLAADIVANVTRTAREAAYRASVEQQIGDCTGLKVSLGDALDVPAPNWVDVDTASINWDEIREFARLAVEMSSTVADRANLSGRASALIEDTVAEIQQYKNLHTAYSQVSSDRPPVQKFKTIGLCMIVKNEAKLIRQCLESTLPLIDYVLVVDTGSTDGTQKIVQDFLAEHRINGSVIDEPWRDFAYNRSFALACLRKVENVDYALIIDADDTLKLDPGFDAKKFKTDMTEAVYDIPIHYAGIAYSRPQICSNRMPFHFLGVLHEYLEGPAAGYSRGDAKGITILASTGGARSQNPRKYQDDASVLERAIAQEHDPFLISRYTFYLAQSWRDSGEKKKALQQYLNRADQGFWEEEIYISLLEAGNIMAELDYPFDEVVAVFERATAKVSRRAEALHAASHYCRTKGNNRKGMEYAHRGLELRQPNGLFVRPWVYHYGILDEYAINAYWAGAYQESLNASLKLLESEKTPKSMTSRIATNARLAAEKLPTAKLPRLGTFGEEDFTFQHKLVAERQLYSRLTKMPRVLLAILAKQKENVLPLYLGCIENLDYPKSSIVLFIRTNNNTDRTERILRNWIDKVGHLYAEVKFDASDVDDRVEQFGEHEWNSTRFAVLGRIRNASMRHALVRTCDYYFVSDVDNFVRPATLRELVALNLPIVSPLLRLINQTSFYSNFHAEIDGNGYYESCDQYQWIINRHVRGIVEVPVVHCTYLVRSDVIEHLTYEDSSGRHEYVVFSESARKANIPQYIDNRQVYGYITFGESDDNYHLHDGVELARKLLTGAGNKEETADWHGLTAVLAD